MAHEDSSLLRWETYLSHILAFFPLIFNCVDPSTKLLNTDPIWIRINKTGYITNPNPGSAFESVWILFQESFSNKDPDPGS